MEGWGEGGGNQWRRSSHSGDTLGSKKTSGDRRCRYLNRTLFEATPGVLTKKRGAAVEFLSKSTGIKRLNFPSQDDLGKARIKGTSEKRGVI